MNARHHYLTAQFRCDGAGKGDLINTSGVSELHVGVCPALSVIYGSAFVPSAADRQLRVAVAQGTKWALQVWIS